MDVAAVIARALVAWRPPPKLSLSEWADQHFRLSPESAAEPGRWKTLPYQRGIMDAITDQSIERISVQKSARVGYTKIIDAAIAFYMAQDPCPILVVQPTLDTAKIYSREEIAPMLRDVEILGGLVSDSSVKTSANTVSHKTFPGGVLSMVGANSGRGFRMVSRRVVIFDEVDAYPPSAGAEGDPIALGEKRAEYYWNRKIIAGSTPLVAGASRIEELYEAGDRRRYYVPCSQCGHLDFLRFSLRDDETPGGHVMVWDEGKPETACFRCSKNGCVIEEDSKHDMIAAGEWRAEDEFLGHASFHIWAAYSSSPGAEWGKIAARFLAAKNDPEKLKTFVNTELGQTWKERGEAPDWERLHERRDQTYKIGSVPADALVVTAGVDVQKDRFVYEVVAWSADKVSHSVDAGVLPGDTSHPETWDKLEELLGRSFPGAGGDDHRIAMMAVDSGYNTQTVYGWCRRHPIGRVIATKGVSGARALIGAPSPVDVTVRGKILKRGYKVWPIGVDVAKGELYGWLRLPRGAGDPPTGYCNFPGYDESYFKQLTAEHLVSTVNRRTRRTKLEWHVLPNRENHYLDARILARVAASLLGIDRLRSGSQPPRPKPPAAPGGGAAPAPPPSSQQAAPRRREGWLTGGASAPRRPGGGWLGRKR